MDRVEPTYQTKSGKELYIIIPPRKQPALSVVVFNLQHMNPWVVLKHLVSQVIPQISMLRCFSPPSSQQAKNEKSHMALTVLLNLSRAGVDKLFSVSIKYLQKIESKEINIFGFVGHIASVAAVLSVQWAPGLQSARPHLQEIRGLF